MSANQPASELTVRDVLSQVDRRLTLIEQDGRELREHMDVRFDAARRESGQPLAAAELGGRLAELSSRLRWGLGMLLATWVTLLGAVVGTSMIR